MWASEASLPPEASQVVAKGDRLRVFFLFLLFFIRPFPFTTVGRMGHMGRSGTSGSFFGTPDLLMPSEQ